MIRMNGWRCGKNVTLVPSLCGLDQVHVDLVVDVWVVVGLSNTDAGDINHLEEDTEYPRLMGILDKFDGEKDKQGHTG